jgi:AraC-like DNA-binding protein
MRFPSYRHLKFGGVLEGSFWLWDKSAGPPVRLEAGDFYLLTSGQPYLSASDPAIAPLDGSDIFARYQCADGVVRYGTGENPVKAAGGRFEFDDDASPVLVKLLPPVIHVRATSESARSLRPVLDLLGLETKSIRAGRTAMAGSLANIVLLSILRSHIDEVQPAPSWLSALGDLKIGAALHLMHGDIGRGWTVQELAAAVGMSRTNFAIRFKALVGMPPLDYLTRWRMSVASIALRHSNDTIATVATRVGYASESAFSSAFKRTFGRSPRHYCIKPKG